MDPESTKPLHVVTPAKAGVQGFGRTWIPAFAGMTNDEFRGMSFLRLMVKIAGM